MPRSTSLTVARIRIQIEIAAVIIPSTVSSLRCICFYGTPPRMRTNLRAGRVLRVCPAHLITRYKAAEKGTGPKVVNTLPPLASEFAVCHGSLGIFAAFDRPLYRK